jgi:hypothetical protein
MKLDEFQVLQRQPCPNNHGVSIPGARVGTRTAEVRTSIPSGCQYSLVCPESVKGTVLHVKSNDANAFPVLHDEIEGEVFNEKIGIVAERLAIEGVQKGVTGTVGGGGATIGLSALPKL